MKVKTIQPKTPPRPGVSIRLTHSEAKDLQTAIYLARKVTGSTTNSELDPLHDHVWPEKSIGRKLLVSLNDSIGALP